MNALKDFIKTFTWYEYVLVIAMIAALLDILIKSL